MDKEEFCAEYIAKKQAEAEVWKRGTRHCQLLLDTGLGVSNLNTRKQAVDNLTAYELSLHQEGLIEKCAILQSNLYHYMRKNAVAMGDRQDPFVIIYGLLWEAKRQILGVESLAELERIRIEYEIIKRFYKKIQE